MLVTAPPTVMIAMLASEKLRSLKSLSGTNGSPLVRACQSTNTPRKNTPTVINSGTETIPLIVPHP